jgi:hypothetical protein
MAAPELSEIDVNRKLLVDAEAALKGKVERLLNIQKSVTDLKKKMAECLDKRLWDQAQAVLDQTHKLSVDAEAADGDVKAAQARVDGLQTAIVRAEEKARKDAMPAPYKPYTAEPLPAAATPAPHTESAPLGATGSIGPS